MNADSLEVWAERHAMLAEAHCFLAIACKNPALMCTDAAEKAQSRIDACADLDAKDRAARVAKRIAAIEAARTHVLPETAK